MFKRVAGVGGEIERDQAHFNSVVEEARMKTEYERGVISKKEYMQFLGYLVDESSSTKAASSEDILVGILTSMGIDSSDMDTAKKNLASILTGKKIEELILPTQASENLVVSPGDIESIDKDFNDAIALTEKLGVSSIKNRKLPLSLEKRMPGETLSAESMSLSEVTILSDNDLQMLDTIAGE